MTTRVLALPGEVSATSLKLPAQTTYEQWETIGAQLQRVATGVMFWLGDWFVFGEQQFGQDSAQAAPLGYQSETLRKASWVCERIASVRRRTDLSFGHHDAVAALEPDEQDRYLGLAASEGWSVGELRGRVRAAKKKNTDDPSVKVPVSVLRRVLEECDVPELAPYVPVDVDEFTSRFDGQVVDVIEVS